MARSGPARSPCGRRRRVVDGSSVGCRRRRRGGHGRRRDGGRDVTGTVLAGSSGTDDRGGDRGRLGRGSARRPARRTARRRRRHRRRPRRRCRRGPTSSRMPTTITPRGPPCCGSGVPPASSTAPPAAVRGEASPPCASGSGIPADPVGRHGHVHSSTVKPPSPAGSSSASASRTRLRIVIAARSGRAGRRRPRPPALLDELVDPVPLEELGLAAHGVGLGQLVDGHVGRDVLVARRRRGSGRPVRGRGTCAATTATAAPPARPWSARA